jgi:hypothetical protein
MHVNRTVINEDIMNLNVVENDGVRGNFKKNGNFTTSTIGLLTLITYILSYYYISHILIYLTIYRE